MGIVIMVILMIYNLLTLYLSVTLCSKYVSADYSFGVALPVIFITFGMNVGIITRLQF
jgi:hypothetical protein